MAYFVGIYANLVHPNVVRWNSSHMLQISILLYSCLYPQDAVEYAECEAVVKGFPPFIEAMKKSGIEDMDLVMVDAW